MTRRGFLQALAPQAARPNVLFIAVDDLRPEFGAYGARHVHSPHLDRLAGQSVAFTRAYCQSALCNPSRASMLTGLRPDALRVWDLNTDFRTTKPDAVTIPQRFKEAGYAAVGVGKIFHNTFPDAASWTEEIRIPGYPFDPDAVYRSADQVAELEQRKRAIVAAGQQQRYIDRYGEWYLKNNATEAPDVPDNAYFDGAQTDAVIAKLGELKRGPFFLGVGYYRPHLPFNAPKRYWDLYDRERIPLAAHRERARGAPAMASNMNRELRGYRDFAQAPRPDQGTLTEAQQRLLRHGYLASVSYVDAQIGRLLGALEAEGLASRTVVVLWGDHGWKLGEHNSWGKMTNYEVDTRIPLLIRAPGVRPGRCDGLVESIDLFPTLAELAGLARPAGLAGESLVPLLRRPGGRGRAAVYTQFLRSGIWTAADGIEYMGRAIRTERHRYVEWRDWRTGELAGKELYDLRRDPHETANAPDTALQERLSAQLRRVLPVPTSRVSAASAAPR
jgi:arylsulfatase A-like enzyme